LLADLIAPDGRRAIDVAVPACMERMKAALFLLGRFEVDKGPLCHRSLTSVVAAAADHVDSKATPAPRVALKAMRTVGQVRAELEGRVGLDPKHTITVFAIFADQEAVDQEAESWKSVLAVAERLNVKVESTSGLSNEITKYIVVPKEPAPSEQAELLLLGNAADTQIAEENSLSPGMSRQNSMQNSKLPHIVKDAMNKMRTTELTGDYPFLLVMQLADRTLLQTIDHDQLAGRDFIAIRDITDDFVYALDDMHKHGGIHADFKPLNAVGDGRDWKIIDFDVSCKLGQSFGGKPPSSGYCPPEMARVLLRATNEKGEVDGEKLAEYKANVAYDLWSFGVVLYHLCFGRPLWLTDINDNVTLEDLRTLASVPDAPLRRALDKALYNGEKSDASNDLKAGAALLRKLLEPDEEKRLECFHKTDSHMSGVLEEPFFKGQDLDAATLKKIVVNQEEMKQEQAKQTALLLENKFELLHTRKVPPSSNPP
jgi:serine/threonine protein kinase